MSAKTCCAIRSRAQRSASTLLVTLCAVLIILCFLSVSSLLTSNFGRLAFRQQGDADLMAAADAGLEYAYAQWKTTASNYFLGEQGTAPVTTSFPSSATMIGNMNSTSEPFNSEGISFTNLSISLADQNGQPSSSTTATGTSTSNVPGYPGWTGTTYNYVATVTVTNPTHYGFTSADPAHLTATRYFQVTRVPLFQAAIFYENKLEIHPGAAMTVSGLIHTNGNLWARGFDTLQFKSTVSYVGTYNEIGDSTITKGWDGYGYGWIPGVGEFNVVPMVTWADGLTTGSSATRATQLAQVGPIDPFGGASTSNNGLYNLIQVPAQGNTSNQIAYNNASLIITVNSSLPSSNPAHLTVTNGSGQALSAADTAAVTAAVNNGVTTTIYDQREAQEITVTNLDMSKLATATVAGTGTPTGLQSSFTGTVYIQDVSPSTSSEAAVRLINGRNLGQNVTVATNNGLYIQGDYNTGGTSASSVPSNVSNPNGTTSPVATGYNRYASAVLADAVTILSNNWSDSNASASLSSRTATPTTVNTAILAGDVPSNSTTGQASGGAHNFPRFLENWNNVNFTYWGSLVEAFNSEEFTGPWQTGNVYYWPNREWNFDTNFLTKQPPGVPNGILFSRGRWQRN
jgi:hypothetical protein